MIFHLGPPRPEILSHVTWPTLKQDYSGTPLEETSWFSSRWWSPYNFSISESSIHILCSILKLLKVGRKSAKWAKSPCQSRLEIISSRTFRLEYELFSYRKTSNFSFAVLFVSSHESDNTTTHLAVFQSALKLATCAKAFPITLGAPWEPLGHRTL